MVRQRRVAVIGAGASGLPCIRHARLYGLDVVCFEASEYVGGLWRYRSSEEETSSVMKSTVINTSKEMTAYSDFPPAPDTPNFMHNTQMYRYLSSYAEHYNLKQYIRFNHKVKNVFRSEDYPVTGQWKVTYVTPQEEEKTETFDGVLMCSGHHSVPYLPEPWEGQEKFRGKVAHSLYYKDHRGYEDKTVIVVGVGNSGGDVAVELSRVAKQVYLVTRRGTWVFNRVFDYGKPLDMALNRKFLYNIRKVVPEPMLNVAIETMLNKRFDHAQYGLKPSHHVLNAHQTINDDLPMRIACGSIKMKPSIQRSNETDIQFVDGTIVNNVDAVILATGYNFEFKLCEMGKLFPVVENEVDLYLNMFPLETADHNTLAIIGLIQPFGSIAPVSEMQARVFFENLAGSRRIPSRKHMQNDVAMKRKDLRTRYVHSRRHTIQIEFIDYMDELAEIIGAKPDFFHMFWKDPYLAMKVEFGPRVSSIYRLQGPNIWEGARKSILSIDQRTYKPTTYSFHGKDSFPMWMTALFAFLLLVSLVRNTFY